MKKSICRKLSSVVKDRIRAAEAEAESDYGFTDNWDEECERLTSIRHACYLMIKSSVSAVADYLADNTSLTSEEKSLIINSANDRCGEDFDKSFKVTRWTILVNRKFKAMKSNALDVVGVPTGLLSKLKD